MSNTFLFLSLLFPRLTLLVAWVFGFMPVNSTPFIVDFLCAGFAPRLLLAYWAYEAHMHPLIPTLFVVMQVLEWTTKRSYGTAQDTGSRHR